MAKFTEAPTCALPSKDGPSVIRVPVMLLGPPSKSIAPQHRIERYWPAVRVRMWFAVEGGSLWFSPGYHTLSLPRFAYAKAIGWWRRWREPVPAARVVQR